MTTTPGLSTSPAAPTTTPPALRGTPPPGPPGSAGVQRRSGWSVRIRITTAVALAVTIALVGVGAIVYAIQSQRQQERTQTDISHKLDEFSALAARGTDPATGTRFGSVGALLDTFLDSDLPDEHQILASWYDGRLQRTLPWHDPYVDTAGFADRLRGLVGHDGTWTIDVPAYGEALVTVQTARVHGQDGALVIVTYLELNRAELQETMGTYLLVALVSLLLITGLAAWQSGRLLAPLRTLRETAEGLGAQGPGPGTLGERDLSRRIAERGNDDITALTRTFNAMLDRIESAFAGQRQFLDDASHELKTPLTILRGHLELLDSSDPAEVAETRALLLDEIDRMSRLVAELMLLAKSSRPDFLAPAPVDLAALTRTLLAKCRGLGSRDWRLDAVGTGCPVLDAQRITQAVIALADNAVKHTRSGGVVALGSSHDEKGTRVWVRDTGPGVPVGERERIFERFAREDVDPTLEDDGFGLGLSIVSAIAHAHGGTVQVEAAVPGPGSVFVIDLPLDGPRHDEEAG